MTRLPFRPRLNDNVPSVNTLFVLEKFFFAFTQQCSEKDPRSHNNGRNTESGVVSMPGHEVMMLDVFVMKPHINTL